MSDENAVSTTPAPLVVDLRGLLRAEDEPGIRWRIDLPGRQLDTNLVRLPPGHTVAQHAEPDLDVVLVVLDGTGTLHTPTGADPLIPGTLTYLPRGTTRTLTAGPHGVAYLTAHGRRPGLRIRPGPPA